VKLLLLASSLLFSTGFVLPAMAQPANTPDNDPLVPLIASHRVVVGMPRETVLASMGAPGTKLSSDVWVYWDFKAVNLPGSEKYDTLIVQFTADHVSLFKLTIAAPVRAFIAQQKLKASRPMVAAK
jgi:hypothetical protein